MAKPIVVPLTGDSSALRKDLKGVANDVEDIGKKADDAEGKSGKLSGALKGVSSVVGGMALGAGLAGGAKALFEMAEGAAADEQATARLDKALENYIMSTAEAGETTADYRSEIQDLKNDMDRRIDAGQKLAFSDDDMRDSMQSLIAATGDYGEASTRQAAAMDLARGANIPLAQATKMLGKLNEENVEVFKKMGITLGEGATEAEALALVQEKFGGQADAYAQSTAGQFEQAKLAMGEITEGIGSAVLPILSQVGLVLAEHLPAIQAFVGEFASGIADIIVPALQALVDFFQAEVLPRILEFGAYFQEEILPRIQEFVAFAQEKLTEFGEFFNTVILPKIQEFMDWLQPKLVELGVWVQEQFGKFKVYYESDIKPALDNIKTGVEAVIAFIVEHWPEIEAVVKPVMAAIQVAVETAIGIIMGVLGILIDLIGGDFSGAWEKAKEVVQLAWDGMKEIVSLTIDALVALVKGLGPLILEGLGNLGDLLLSAGEDLINGLINGIKAKAGEAVQSVKNLAGDMVGGAKDALKIWSPSRVFAEIGEQIPAGLVEGIEEGSQDAYIAMANWINGLGDEARSAWWLANADFARELGNAGLFVEEDGSVGAGVTGGNYGASYGVSSGFEDWLIKNGFTKNGTTGGWDPPGATGAGSGLAGGAGFGSASSAGGGFGQGAYGAGRVPWDGTGAEPENWYGVGELVGQTGSRATSGYNPNGSSAPGAESGATFTGGSPGKTGPAASGGGKGASGGGGAGKGDEQMGLLVEQGVRNENRFGAIVNLLERLTKTVEQMARDGANPVVINLPPGDPRGDIRRIIGIIADELNRYNSTRPSGATA